MEKYSFGTLPPEVWCHILSFVDDFIDVIHLKIVNRLFYQELASRDPFKSFDPSIKIPEDCLKYFMSRDTSYPLPRDLMSIVPNQSISIVRHGQIHIKSIVIGTSGVGKTTFLNSFVYGRYKAEDYGGTIGCAFLTRKFTDPDGIITKFELWDTAGQERFRSLAPMYYRGARAVLLCFSIDNRSSVVSLLNQFLLDIHKAYKSLRPEEQPVMYLLGLKSDLENKRQVSVNEARTIALVLKMKYFECSSGLFRGVNEVMGSMKDDLLKNLRIPSPELLAPPAAPDPVGRRWCSIQ